MGKKRRHPVSDKQIIAAYKKLQSTMQVSARFDIGQTTILRVLEKNKIPRNGLKLWREKARLFTLRRAKGLRKIYESGVPISQLAERHDVSDSAIKSSLLRAGCKLRKNPAQLIRPGELQKMVKLWRIGFSQMKISIEVDRSQTFVSNALRKAGYRFKIRKRENHGNWKGGIAMSPSGYKMIRLRENDPMLPLTNQSGYALEHRLKMARKLGRLLHRDETVHHINGNKLDNSLKNLQLRQGRHGNGIVMRCKDCGSNNVHPMPLN